MPHLTPSTTASGLHLRVDGVSFSYPDRRVLTDVSFVVSSGDRVGLIGENGSGKSTLLRIVAGLLAPDAGTVSIAGEGHHTARIGLLHQEPPFSASASIGAALEQAIGPLRRVTAQVSTLADALSAQPDDPAVLDAYARALDTAERLDAWNADVRVDTTLAGLGLSGVDRSRPTGALSGGQRARLSLAWLLLSTPDVLALDEPTNHLDDDAAAFLVSVLRAWRGPVLAASHDRAFLDEAVTALVDLDPAPVPHAVAGPLADGGPGSGIGVTRFTGTFSDYLTARADARARWERQYRDEQAELNDLRAAVRDQHTVGHTDWKPRTEVRAARKHYADRNAAVVSRRVNDARGRLEELEKKQIRKPPAVLQFAGLDAAATRSGDVDGQGPVLTASGVGVEGRLAPTTLAISRGERWLITGPNGSGKSTLLSVLAGTLAPDTGQVSHARADRVGLLTQNTELPDPMARGAGRTVATAYADLVGEQRATQVPLSTFGLVAPRDFNRPVLALSVGQQRRLALAVLLADPPEILLLDEPTNHFSLPLVAALEGAIGHYPGTVVVASHDRWLREHWAGERFALAANSTGPAGSAGRNT